MIGNSRIPWIRLGIALFLIAGLPVFIWAVATQRIELRKRAAPVTANICWNRVVEFDGKFNWPDGCKGDPNAQGCVQVLVPLTDEELTGYKTWISNGKPYLPGCGGPTPTPAPPGPSICDASKDGAACTDTCARACPPDVKVCTDQCTTRTGTCISGKCETWLLTPTPSTTVCSGAKEGAACTDTCAPACPPGTQGCIDKCTVRTGFCVGGKCETWLTPTPSCTPRPACLDAKPPCLMPEPTNACPASPTPIPTTGQNVCSGAKNGTPCTDTCAPACPPGTKNCIDLCTTRTGFCVNGKCETWPTATPTLYPTLSYYPTPTSRATYYPTPTRPPYPSISQYLTPTPTATPILLPINLTFRVKLTGVAGAEAKGATIRVKLKFKDGTVRQLSQPLVLSSIGNGVYSATAVLTNPPPAGSSFRVLVKGEKHSQMVFCRQSGQTEPCNDTDYITPTSYTFDFTGRPLPPGDLNQDGKVNADDIKIITDLFKKPSSQQTPGDLKLADVNYSGKVDSLDLSLVFQTLNTRYDEQ